MGYVAIDFSCCWWGIEVLGRGSDEDGDIKHEAKERKR